MRALALRLLPFVLAGGLAAQRPAAGEPVLVRVGAERAFAELGRAAGWPEWAGCGCAKGELRAGATWRWHAAAKAADDAPGWRTAQVLLVVPDRLVVLQGSAEAGIRPTAVVQLEPLGPDRCRLRITGEGEVAALPLPTAAALRFAEHLVPDEDPAAPARVRGLLQPLVGGTWMAEDGAHASRWSAAERVGQGLEFEFARAVGGTPQLTQRLLVLPDPAADALQFVRWSADGGVERGAVRVDDAGRLAFVSQGGATGTWAIRSGVVVADGLSYRRRDALPQKLR